MASQSPSPSTAAMREHFVKRLTPRVSIKGSTPIHRHIHMYVAPSGHQYCYIFFEFSQEKEASPVALQLQLVKEEYQLLTEELDTLIPQYCTG